MKNTEQIINLTPPIDGVQYGVSDEQIKKGDWMWNQWKGTFEGCFGIAGETWHESMKKVICSTNPKDTRFPYLVMPSKEQEVERLAESYSNGFPITSKAECGSAYQTGLNDGFIAGFNANKGIYTQEQLLEFTKWVDDNEIPYEGGNWIKYFDGRDNYLNTTELFEIYLQSLQPTVKAVVVEMEENNCDGCKAGIPVDEYNYHRMGKGIYPDFMICQKDKYNKIKVEKSTEYPQGIVRAIEVIY